MHATASQPPPLAAHPSPSAPSSHPPHPSECLGKGTYWTPETGLTQSNRLVAIPGLTPPYSTSLLDRPGPAAAPQPLPPSARAPARNGRMPHVHVTSRATSAVSPASELNEDGKGGDPTRAAGEASPGAGGVTSGGARTRARRGALTVSRPPVVTRAYLLTCSRTCARTHALTAYGSRHTFREQSAAQLRQPHQAQDLRQARRGTCAALPHGGPARLRLGDLRR